MGQPLEGWAKARYEINHLIKKAAAAIPKLENPAASSYVVYELARLAISAICCPSPRQAECDYQLLHESIDELNRALKDAVDGAPRVQG